MLGADCGKGEGRRPGQRGRAGALVRDRAVAQILDLVGATRGVTRAELLSRRRCSNEVARARQLAMYLVHTLLGWTYLEVGHLFGRDRTTVSYACARIEDQREDRSPFECEVEAIESAVARHREVNRAAA